MKGQHKRYITIKKKIVLEVHPELELFKTWGEFKQARLSNDMEIESFEKCFACGRKFLDTEKIRLAHKSGKNSVAICETCLKKSKNVK